MKRKREEMSCEWMTMMTKGKIEEEIMDGETEVRSNICCY